LIQILQDAIQRKLEGIERAKDEITKLKEELIDMGVDSEQERISP